MSKPPDQIPQIELAAVVRRIRDVLAEDSQPTGGRPIMALHYVYRLSGLAERRTEVSGPVLV